MLDTVNTFLLIAILMIQILHVVPGRDLRPTIWLLLLLGIGGAVLVSWIHFPTAFPDVVLSALGIFVIGLVVEAVVEHRTSSKLIQEATTAYEQRLAKGETKPFVPSESQPSRPRELNWLHWLTSLTLPFITFGGLLAILSPGPSLLTKGIAGVFALAALLALPFAIRAADRRIKAERTKQGYAEAYRKYDERVAREQRTKAEGTEMEPRTPT